MIEHCPGCGAANRVPASRLHQSAHCGKCKAALSPLQHPHAVQSEADFDDLTRDSSVPVLVDFWAAWCGPCRAVAPELEALARKHAGELLVAKVDTEALPGLSARFGIRSIPTLMLFQNGRLQKQVAGAMKAAQIEQQFGL